MQLAASVELGARGSGRSRDGQGRRALRRTVSLLLSKHGDLNAAATAAHQLSSHGERALMPQHLAIRFDRQAAAPFGSALQSPSAASRPGVIVITLLIVFRGNRCSRLTHNAAACKCARPGRPGRGIAQVCAAATQHFVLQQGAKTPINSAPASSPRGLEQFLAGCAACARPAGAGAAPQILRGAAAAGRGWE